MSSAYTTQRLLHLSVLDLPRTDIFSITSNFCSYYPDSKRHYYVHKWIDKTSQPCYAESDLCVYVVLKFGAVPYQKKYNLTKCLGCSTHATCKSVAIALCNIIGELSVKKGGGRKIFSPVRHSLFLCFPFLHRMTPNITSLGSTPGHGKPSHAFPTRSHPPSLPRCAQAPFMSSVQKAAYLTGARQSAVVDRPQVTRRDTSLRLSHFTTCLSSQLTSVDSLSFSQRVTLN